MTDTSADGGRAAIAGFVYQMLVIPGAIAAAWEGPAGSDGQNLEMLLALTRESKVSPERFDQDMVLDSLNPAGPKDCSLVQIKYSQPPPSSIGPKELVGILDALDTSRRRARSNGKTSVNYFLVTNRRLGSELQRHLDAAQAKQVPSAPKQKTWLASYKEIVKPARRKALKKLMVIPDVQWASWEALLRATGNRHYWRRRVVGRVGQR